MTLNFCSRKFSYKTLHLKKLNFWDKVSITFMKIQIDTSYDVGNIRW